MPSETVRYRLDGSLFNLRRLTAKTKSLQILLQEVLFADDCTPVAHVESDLQMMLDRFSEAPKLFGLTVSLGKTEVLHQLAPTRTQHCHRRGTSCQCRTLQVPGKHHFL